jgi:small GTP-binding protein
MSQADLPMKPPQEFKVVLCGNSFVGKTSIVQRYCYGCFSSVTPPTLGGDLVEHVLQSATGNLKLDIWDTAGQEQYQAIGSIFFHSAALAFVVYDVTTEEPLSIVKKWITQIHEKESSAIIVVFGNKTDLVENPQPEVAEWCAEQGLKHFFCSALSGTGIVEGFAHAAEVLRDRLPPQPSSELVPDAPRQWCC